MKHHLINRREFLGTTAAGGALFASGLFSQRLLASDTGQLSKPPPVKIYKIFAGRTGDSYLTRPTEELARFNQYFSELENKLGDVQFVGGDLMPPADAGPLAEKVKEADAVLIIHMSSQGSDVPALSKIVDAGLPTALFSEPYSGHDWMYLPELRKQGRKVLLLPSSDWSQLDRAVALMRVPAWLKQTRIIAWGPPQGTECRLLGRTDQGTVWRGVDFLYRRPGKGDLEEHRPRRGRGRGGAGPGSNTPEKSSSLTGKRSSRRPGCFWR